MDSCLLLTGWFQLLSKNEEVVIIENTYMKHEQGHMCGGMSGPTACAATEFRYHDHSWAPALHTVSYLWTGEMTQWLRSLVLEEDLGLSQHPHGSSHCP